jgi:multidrug efflux system outer membrane protein
MRRVLSAAAVLALSACTVGPKYQRPDLPLPEAYQAPVATKEATSFADLGWWQTFRDPVLQRLIREALAANQDLALATARVDEARALAGVSRAAFWPRVGLSANYTYGQQMSNNAQEQLGTTSIRGPAPNVGIFGSLSWEIDVWGKLRNASAAASAELMATEAVRRGVIVTLVAEVARAYVELRQLDLQLKIATENATLRKGTLDLFTDRSDVGVGNNLEVSQARADLASTSATIPATRRLIALRESELAVLRGLPPGPVTRPEEVALPLPPALPLGVPAALLERRPDVMGAEQRAIAANARVGVAVANRLPSFNLGGIVGLASPSFTNLFGAGSLAWTVGGGIFQPIFEGGRLALEQEAAEAVSDQRVAAFRQTVLTAVREVTDAAVSVREFGAVRREREIEVAAAREGQELAMLRYRGGVSSYLEVLDAQRRAFQAELTLVDATRDELVSAILLYRALGGGWVSEPSPPSGGSAPPP